MKILVFGAGVIGSVIAAKLYEAGNDIILLARGNRYEKIKQDGVVLHDVVSGGLTHLKIPITNSFHTDDQYDMIIVTVRFDQLDQAKQELKQKSCFQTIFFMLNNPGNSRELTREFPDKRIILGFPGFGGTYRDGRIDYLAIKEQKTTLGDLDGGISNLTEQFSTMLTKAGFKVAISTNMEAWLKTHAIFMSCIAAAILQENGDNLRLGMNKGKVRNMVEGIKEGFRALQELGIPIVPQNLKTIFLRMPAWFSVWYWQKTLQGRTGSLAMAPHILSAKGEMQLIAQEILRLIHASSTPTPTLDRLLYQIS
jgi:2-dehydropantoate 2-reductase